MPKIHNTNKHRRQQLFERLTPHHLIYYTSIFHDPISGPKLDPYTVDYIKAEYARYFISWIEPDAKKFILNEKINP